MLRLLFVLFFSVTALHAQTTIKPMWQQTYTRHVGKDALFSLDGSSIITLGNGSVCLWDAKSGALKTNIRGSYYCISDSLVAVIAGTTCDVWNYHTPKRLYSFDGKDVIRMIFDKSGTYLAISKFGRVEVREARSGTLIQTMYNDDLNYDYWFLSFSPDASLLIASTDYQPSGVASKTRMWNVKEGTLIQEVFSAFGDSDCPLVFSDKENILAYYSRKKNTIIFRDIVTNNQVGEIPAGGNIVSIGVPESGNCITQNDWGYIVLWDIHNGNLKLRYEGLSYQPDYIRFNADTSLLIASGYIWDIKTAELVKKTSIVNGRHTEKCALFSGTDILISQDDGSFVLDWSADTVKNTFSPIPFSLNSYLLCNESADEIFLRSDMVIEKRRLSTGELTGVLNVNITNPFETFVGLNKSGEYALKSTLKLDALFQPDSQIYSLVKTDNGAEKWCVTTILHREGICINHYNNTIAFVKNGTLIKVYDTSGKILQTIDNSPYTVSDLFFDTEGTDLFVLSSGMVRKWNVKKNEIILQKAHNGLFSSPAMFNESQGIFVTGDTSNFYIWDIHVGKILDTIENHRKYFDVKFSPTDNNILVYDKVKNTAEVIEVSSRKTLFTIKDSASFMPYYDPQGKFIYLDGLFRKYPKIFDARNGKHITDLVGMNGEPVYYPHFSDNSRYAIALAEQGDLAVWDLKDLIPTSVENDDTPSAVEHNLLTFSHSDNELNVLMNAPLHHTQNFTIYNVCGQKMQGGIIPSSSSEYTVHYDTLQSGVYYFECTVNGDRYVYQFAIIR